MENVTDTDVIFPIPFTKSKAKFDAKGFINYKYGYIFPLIASFSAVIVLSFAIYMVTTADTPFQRAMFSVFAVLCFIPIFVNTKIFLHVRKVKRLRGLK